MVMMGIPGEYFPVVVTFWDWLSPDKIIHIIIFAVFSFVTLWGYRNIMLTKNKKYLNRILLLTLLFTISYGGLTEIFQKFVFINRYGSLYDFIADIIGCIWGVIIFLFFYKKKLKKITNTEINI